MSDSEILHILLIEDNPADARLIQELLREVEESTLFVRSAPNLELGLAELQNGRADLVLLDLMLPDSAGMETFLRVHEETPNVPIVVLSGLEDRELAISAVAKGAQEFLVKGKLDGYSLGRVIRFAVARNQRDRAERALRVAEEQFRLAREVQRQFFPDHPPLLPGMDIAGETYPAEAAGGDYFDYLQLPDETWAIVVGDVSGHGLGPALLMSEARAYLRALCESHDDAGIILTHLNRLLMRDGAAGRFITLCLVRIDTAERSFRYASGGQRGYLLPADGTVQVLESTGMVLGIVENAAVEQSPSIEISAGDIVLLPTDGILEAARPSGERFGAERSLAVVADLRDRPAREIVDRLYAAVCDFSEGPLNDDVTAVVIKAR